MMIGISGHMNAGKSTVAKYLVENYGLREDSFAYSLRLVKCAITSIPIEETYSVEDKNKVIPILGITRGQFLQDVGLHFRNYRENIWVESLELRWIANGKDKLVVSDVRFTNEVNFIETNHGVVLRLERPFVDNGDTRNKTHASETSLDDHPFDNIIHNDGTLDELFAKVDLFCNRVGLEKINN